uniref:type IV secretion system protein n=1 Tax=Citrobacter koseri TaxID=545 RepID=UPI002B05C67C
KTGSFGPYGCPENLSVRFFPNSAGSPERTTVHINSVITDREHGVATVRFTTQQRIRQRPNPEPPRYWIATIAYEYKALPMTAQQRYINPLGFRVTSYRKNAENVGAVGG